MSTRRRYLAGLGLTAAGLTLAPAVPAAAAPPARAAGQPGEPPEPFGLIARRTELTLPELPALGLTYICALDLFDESENAVGTAAAGASVVGMTLEGPVVLASVVLRLSDGAIHYQRVMDRFGEFPRTAVGAILGGTGAYGDLAGEVDISWPDQDRIDLMIRPAGTTEPEP